MTELLRQLRDALDADDYARAADFLDQLFLTIDETEAEPEISPRQGAGQTPRGEANARPPQPLEAA